MGIPNGVLLSERALMDREQRDTYSLLSLSTSSDRVNIDFMSKLLIKLAEYAADHTSTGIFRRSMNFRTAGVNCLRRRWMMPMGRVSSGMFHGMATKEPCCTSLRTVG